MTCLTCVYYEASCKFCGCHGTEKQPGEYCELYNRRSEVEKIKLRKGRKR